MNRDLCVIPIHGQSIATVNIISHFPYPVSCCFVVPIPEYFVYVPLTHSVTSVICIPLLLARV